MTITAPSTDLGVGTWTIDPAHSEVGFTVRHLMSKVRGQFTQFSGAIRTNGEPVHGSVEVTIESASITTHNEQRDAHLRSADFFDPANGGELRFISTGIRAAQRRLRDHRRPDDQRHHPLGRSGRRLPGRGHRRVRADSGSAPRRARRSTGGTST